MLLRLPSRPEPSTSCSINQSGLTSPDTFEEERGTMCIAHIGSRARGSEAPTRKEGGDERWTGQRGTEEEEGEEETGRRGESPRGGGGREMYARAQAGRGGLL